MDKDAVEAKTRRFQHKIERLRPVLDTRRKVWAQQKKASGQRLRKRIMAVALGVAGAVLLPLYILLPRAPDRHATAVPEPLARAARPAPPAVQDKPAVSAPAEDPAPPPAAAEAESSLPLVAALTVTVAAAETAEVPPAETVARPRIVRSQSCREVRARECSQPQASFAPHERPHVWMVVSTQSAPDVLTHVWYHEGRKYCEVPLAIEHLRTRTWSSVSLRGPVHLGAWKVEIVTQGGDILDEVAFSVGP